MVAYNGMNDLALTWKYDQKSKNVRCQLLCLSIMPLGKKTKRFGWFTINALLNVSTALVHFPSCSIQRSSSPLILRWFRLPLAVYNMMTSVPFFSTVDAFQNYRQAPSLFWVRVFFIPSEKINFLTNMQRMPLRFVRLIYLHSPSFACGIDWPVTPENLLTFFSLSRSYFNKG